MKKTKKALFTAVTAALACTLTSGLAMTAFADEATKDHEFDVKNDIVFEDFDRADISNTVATPDASNVDLGEKPYLHVEFDAITAETPAGDRNSQIYKQGSGSLAKVKDGGAIRITMRAPDGGLTLSQLNFAVRGVDNDAQVCIKGFEELSDSAMEKLPDLTAEWATYEIDFANTYEDIDVYPETTTTVTGEGSADLLGFHIFADEDVAGVLDIATIEYKTGSGTYMLLNNFTGGADVTATAKSVDEATWWAGSATGSIVKRMPTLSEGGEMTVVKEAAVGKYSYAVIETEGNIDGLKVATTTDGTTFGTPEAYDGYSVALTGEEKGFKFVNEGTESVKIKRIYLTNLEVIIPDTATPVIDASSAKSLDDFGAAQKGFSGDYDSMVSAVTNENLYYRMSYNGADKVEIKDGMLVFDATELGDGLINFKFQSKTAYSKKYIVLKMKQEGEGANLNDFRFGLVDGDGKTSEPIYANQFKSGVGYASKLLDESNPYRDGEWYYVIIDIEQSGFPEYAGYAGLNMYYNGTGKLYFDEIFFADEKDLPPVEMTKTLDTKAEFAAAVDYAYQYLYIPSDGTYQTLSFDITPADDDFDISNLRLGINDGTYWASENADGTLLTPDGKKLNELEYKKGVATQVTIDLAKSGIDGAFADVHAHRNNIGAFKLDNMSLYKAVSRYDKIIDEENKVTVMDGENAKTITVTAPEGGYTYAGGLDVAKAEYAALELTFTPGDDFVAVDGIRLEFKDVGTRWASANDEGSLITADGKRIDEFVAAYLTEHPDYDGEPITITIDLKASGIESAFSTVHVHSNGAATGGFTITDVKFTPYKDLLSEYYAEAVEDLPMYLDAVNPTVSITTATTAKAGDEITVAYTASDNKTATADLSVEITVTKDGNDVALTNGKFTAEEGVYTVTVKVTDLAGNEATDVKQITVSKKGGTTGGNTGSEGTGLGGGAIAGIVIGCIAGVGLIAVGAFFLIKHLRKKKSEKK